MEDIELDISYFEDDNSFIKINFDKENMEIGEQLEEFIKNKKKWPMVYIDPPYSYKNKNGNNFFGCCEYKTLTDEELKSLKIAEILEEDSLVLMWSTSPKLQSSFNIAKAWNLKYVNVFLNWKKTQKYSNKCAISTGNYTRSCTEFLLLFKNATTKSSKKFVKNLKGKKIFNNIIETQELFLESTRLTHSEKPTVIYEIIENFFYLIPSIEIFSRRKNKNFLSVGDEVNKFYSKDSTNYIEIEKIRKIQNENWNILKNIKNYKEGCSKLETDKYNKIYFKEDFKKLNLKHKGENYFPTLTQFIKNKK